MVTNVVGRVIYIGSIQLDHAHISAAGVKVWDFISYLSRNSIVLLLLVWSDQGTCIYMSYFLIPTFIEAFNLDLYINSEVWLKEQGAIRSGAEKHSNKCCEDRV